MHRAVEMLGGGILGLIAGSFLCAPLIAHVFGPTTVSWDTSACPPGIYTITSTATSLDGGRSFTATTAHIRLPKGSIVQEFSDLPFGQYLVSAIARDARGRIFNSDQQNISGQGSTRGRQAGRVSGSVPKGSPAVASRPTPVKVTALAPSDSSTASMVISPEPVVQAEHRFQLPRGMAELLAAFPQWKSLVFIDEDGDGVVDEVRIEFESGEVWVARGPAG